MKKVRVLIVEDSAVVREHLRRIISADPRLEVAGLAASGEEALEMVVRVLPDVISMDIQLPGIQGFEATRQIMSLRPTPIVVVSGMEAEDLSLSMQALRSGALAVIEKPVASTHEGYVALAGRLCTQLAIMSEVKVVRQRDLVPRKPEPVKRSYPSLRAGSPYIAVAIGASTGGPNALVQVLNGLGSNFALPIALVQHMTPGFIDGFSDWLQGVTPFRVQVVRGPMTMEPATVYVALTGSHLTLDGLTANVDNSPPVGSHKPSATILFSSMARTIRSAGIGVILTGMGDDGATGLRDLKDAGGLTIAESKSTAVVYGMPAAAVALGAVCESLPVTDIAGRLLELPVRSSGSI